MRRRFQRKPMMEPLEGRRTPSLVAGPTITHSRMTLGVSEAGPSYVQTHDFVSRRSRDVVLVHAKADGTVILALQEQGTTSKSGASFAVESVGGQVVFSSTPGNEVDRFTIGRGRAFYVIVSPTGKGISSYSLSYQLA